MWDITDTIVEDFLPEDIDQIAANEFTKALGNKGDTERYIDTEAFHKAYGQAIKDSGLSDIFDPNTGLLKSRGMYGKILNCMDPVLQKALKKLWVAQYVDDLESKIEVEKKATREKQLNQELDDYANFVKQTYFPEIINDVRKEEPQLVDDFEKYSGKKVIDAFNTEAWRSAWEMYVKYSLNIPDSDKELGHTTINKSDLNNEEQRKYKIEDILELLHKWIAKYKFLNISKIIDDKLIKLGISNPTAYDTYQFIDTETKERYIYSEDHHYSGDKRVSQGWILKKVVKSKQQYNNGYTYYDRVPVQDLAEINIDNLELFMVDTYSSYSSGGGIGSPTYHDSTTYYYFNPNNPADLNKAGGAMLKEQDGDNGVTDCKFIPEEDIPAELKAIGFTAGERQRLEIDSSD